MAAYQKAMQKPESQRQAKVNKPGSQSVKKVNAQQLITAPDTLRAEEVLAAQQQFGNQVVQRALADKDQPKALTDPQGNLRDDISSSIQQARGSGGSLPKEVQQEMSRKLGRDFSDVRLHTDGKADELSQTINARAFTIGSDIFFKSGVFAPTTQKGRETLVHELTHVVQQSGSRTSGGKLKLGAPNTAMEKEADHKGKQSSQVVTTATTAAIQRSEEEELIQGQEDEEEIQTQEDEEEIQKQGEEEEIQTQPDAGGVVQRGIFDWFKKKKPESGVPEAPPPAPEYKPQFGPVKPRGKPLTEKGQHVLESIKNTKSGGGDLSSQLGEQKKKMGLDESSTKESKAKHAENLKGLEEEQTHSFKRDTSTGIEKGKFTKAQQKIDLMNTIKNPKSTPEQMQAAEDKLRTFHQSGAFKKNPATIAKEEREKSLKESASKGDDKAAELYKKENPSFGTKVKGFAGKAMDFYGKHKDTIGSVLGALGLGGGKDKEKDKKEEKAPSGGGGGGGGYDIISQLLKENKELRDQLATAKK